MQNQGVIILVLNYNAFSILEIIYLPILGNFPEPPMFLDKILPETSAKTSLQASGESPLCESEISNSKIG
jgi:hypothetical protein